MAYILAPNLLRPPSYSPPRFPAATSPRRPRPLCTATASATPTSTPQPQHPNPQQPAHSSQSPSLASQDSQSQSQRPRRIISSLENVSYDVAGVRVIEDVSLELRDGEIVCILGPSGSGKSTILRILAGLSRPSSGSALYHGRPFPGTNPGTSIVFQTFALYPWLTVLENVELGLSHLPGLNRDLRRARALAAVDTIGLDGYENALPRELSGGMRQRVGFARALAVEPELLCMDEPFSALDVLTAENLRSELLRLWQVGDVPTAAVLIVTHNIEEAVSLADRIVILGRDPGRVRTVLPVPLRHPRNRKSTIFQQLADLVYTILSDRDYTLSADDMRVLSGEVIDAENGEAAQPGAPAVPLNLEGMSLSDPLHPLSLDEPLPPPPNPKPGCSQRYPQLPAVRIGSVSGLLSFIAEEPADLYRLGQRLQLDVDDLYPLIEAARILNLIEVDEGDVRINDRGLRFVKASIDDRKNIVRLACLSAPGARLIAQVYRMLREAQRHELPQDIIFDTVLLKHFSPVESRRQMEIAIEWGRFAELFGYEVLTGTLFLDLEDNVAEVA